MNTNTREHFTLRKASSEPFSMYSVTIMTNLPAEDKGGQVNRQVTFLREAWCQALLGATLIQAGGLPAAQ